MEKRTTPMDFDLVTRELEASGLKSIGQASIREVKKLIDNIEKATGERFVRMEMGIPGLPPLSVGVEAQIAALRKGVAAIYPDIQGIPELKPEMARFVKLFLDVDVDPERISEVAAFIPGAMRGITSERQLGGYYDLDKARRGLTNAIVNYLQHSRR